MKPTEEHARCARSRSRRSRARRRATRTRGPAARRRSRRGRVRARARLRRELRSRLRRRRQHGDALRRTQAVYVTPQAEGEARWGGKVQRARRGSCASTCTAPATSSRPLARATRARARARSPSRGRGPKLTRPLPARQRHNAGILNHHVGITWQLEQSARVDPGVAAHYWDYTIDAGRAPAGPVARAGRRLRARALLAVGDEASGAPFPPPPPRAPPLRPKVRRARVRRRLVRHGRHRRHGEPAVASGRRDRQRPS